MQLIYILKLMSPLSIRVERGAFPSSRKSGRKDRCFNYAFLATQHVRDLYLEISGLHTSKITRTTCNISYARTSFCFAIFDIRLFFVTDLGNRRMNWGWGRGKQKNVSIKWKSSFQAYNISCVMTHALDFRHHTSIWCQQLMHGSVPLTRKPVRVAVTRPQSSRKRNDNFAATGISSTMKFEADSCC